MITIEDFEKIDMKIGTIANVTVNKNARKSSYKLEIDFGEEIGIKTSSAQLTENYSADELIGVQVIAVMNFPPRKVADVKSEVLVLGCKSKLGTVLLKPERDVENGIIIY